MNTLLFIPSLLEGDINAFMVKIGIVLFLWFIVIAASLIDLISGIAASKRTGQKKTTSWGIRKTMQKDLQYFALLFVFLLLDVGLSALSPWLSVFSVPLLSVLGVIAITATEALSVAENTRKGRNKEEDKIDDIQQLVSTTVEMLGSEKTSQFLEALQKYQEIRKS